jgi:hypothetical protein
LFSTPFAKLDEGKVATILRRLLGGEGGRALAREYGVSHSVISLIKSGKTWRHVKRKVAE